MDQRLNRDSQGVLGVVEEWTSRHVDELQDLARELVRAPTVLGAEESGQKIVESFLADAGFAVERIQPDAASALADPHGGYPSLSYEDRSCVAGRRSGSRNGRSLHLSGHIDVVPVESQARWSHDPWAGDVSDGRLWGRGSGDMKAGLAAYLIGAKAAIEIGGTLNGDLIFTSVIEEENGGNGMRAVLAAEYSADATLIGEPTGLSILHEGIGVVWARLTALGSGSHAADTTPASAPLERIIDAVGGLRRLERRLNARETQHRYKLNLGQIEGGVWPSSAPTEVTLRVRVGFPSTYEPADIQGLIAEAVEQAASGVDVAFDGFRAHAYAHDLNNPFVEVVDGAHMAIHGRTPARTSTTATTDARYVSGHCYCYGPVAGSLHSIDEWADVKSIRDTALLVALVALDWCR